MGEKRTHPGAAGRATSADQPTSLRNVVLVGHSGAGKTTLVEALALATGAVNRAGRVEDGGCLSDYDEIEHRQQRSVQLSLVPVDWGGIKINLLDTPGYADFVGQSRAGLRAADAALFVVSAADGVDGATRMVWDECAAVGGMPRALVVTHLEAARADFDQMTRLCGTTLGGDDPDAVLPLYLPLYGAAGADGHAPVHGLIGLLTQRVFDYSSGERVERAPEADELPLIEEARNRLIEGIIAESEDESLMDRYLAGEDIDLKTLVGDLETAVARGTFHTRARRGAGRGGRPAGAGHHRAARPDRAWLPHPRRARGPGRHHSRRQAPPRADLRSGRPAGRRGGQDLLGPVRRPPLAGTGLLRHPAPGRDGARVRARAAGPGPRGPRRGRADRRAVRPVRQDAALADQGDRRRPGLCGEADPARRPATPCPTRTRRS
ncbi:Elongation factor G, mitochondrial [Streptomyces rimosus subsp. rimosus]